MIKTNPVSALAAGVMYFVGVFSLGFMLGALRLMILLPYLGELVAVMIEVPVILTGCWILCGRAIVQLQLGSSWLDRMVMGFSAFSLLLIAEFGLSKVMYSQNLVEFVQQILTPAGLVGIAGQLLFAAFPLIQLLKDPKQ